MQPIGEKEQDVSDVLWETGKRLCVAAQEEQMELLVQLLDKKGNPTITDGAGYTPLHYAARNGNIDIIGVLLEVKIPTSFSWERVNRLPCSEPLPI